VYPCFATFAAWYGRKSDAERTNGLLQLACNSTALSQLINLDDRAFLFFVYGTYLCNLNQNAGWYCQKEAETAIKNIRRWMEKEDENAAAQKKASLAVAKHLKNMEDTLKNCAVEVGDSDGSTSSDEDLEN
jgi:hypothetical protein